MKLFAQFFVGFVGTILLLNAITWLFGQAVAAIVAWFVALGALAMIVVGMTAGGYEAPMMTAAEAEAIIKFNTKS